MKLVTIAGSGRTGSTLLSVLLSQAPDTFNLGQLRDIWASYVKNEPCTCGAPLQSCPVWSAIVRTAFGDKPAKKMKAMHAGVIAFAEAAAKVPDWGRTPLPETLVAGSREYLAGLKVFFEAVGTVTGATTLVDASKSPEIAMAFSLVEGIDLHVLNLVRDPRAVAASWEKKKGVEMALRQSQTWLQRQTTLMRWSHALGSRFALLRYEDFTAHPQELVGNLYRWAGLGTGVDFFTSESHAELSWANQHLYPPGNEKLLAEKSASVDIIEATAWRTTGNPGLLRQVEKIIGPVLAQFNYTEGGYGEGTPAATAPVADAVPKQPKAPAPRTAPAAMSAPGTEPQYVFLICSERSGSNLIGAMLNNHGEIGSTPPYHLCREVGLNWHALLGTQAGGPAWKKVGEVVAGRLGKFRTAEVAAEFSQWFTAQRAPSFGDLAREVFGRFSGLDGKRSIFIKENNIHRMLFFILQHFPDAKFVFQVRDPRDYLLSAINRKDGAMGNKFGSSMRALEIWREDQLGGLSALAHLGSERVFFQRYEDLLREPRRVLSALCTFLGVPFDEAMLDFHESGYAQDLAVAGGPRENLAKPLMADNFSKYKQGLSTEQIRMVEIYLGDVMTRLGYPRDFPDTAKPSRQELFWPQFLEPVERIANGETSPFYNDGAMLDLGELAVNLQPAYGNV